MQNDGLNTNQAQYLRQTVLIRYVWVSLLLLMWGAMGCAPTLYINETYRKALEVPVVDGNIALDNGVQIEIRAILKEEKQTPEKVWVTRLLGAYVLAANGFRRVWMLRPTGETKASYAGIELLASGTLQDIRLLHNSAYRCVTLTTGGGAGKTWFIHGSGAVGEKCNDKAND